MVLTIQAMQQNTDPRRQNEARAAEIIKHRLSQVFELFEDPAVTEISINGGQNVWITKSGRREEVPGVTVHEATLASTLRELASSQGQDCIPETPSSMVHSKLPGLRFAGCLYPTSSAGTSLSIRKHSPRVLSLSDYVQSGTMPQAIADLLSKLVMQGANILIAGGTDSGKTTFLNALSREIPLDVRVGTIEDTRELSLVVKNWLPLEYNKQRGVTATLCVDFMMRSSPDRIILGEMKDEVAAFFLEAANTGHNGCMATVHANSGQEALGRFEVLVLRAGLGWPLNAIRQSIASTIHYVVHMRKHDGKRQLSEIVRLRGYDDATATYRMEHIFDARTPEEVSDQ